MFQFISGCKGSNGELKHSQLCYIYIMQSPNINTWYIWIGIHNKVFSFSRINEVMLIYQENLR